MSTITPTSYLPPLNQDEFRTIPLTQGKFAIVDVDDFEELSKRKWHAWFCPTTQSHYALRKLPTLPDGKRNASRMHREIMNLPFGDPREVDHINHDTLDNRKSNLRVVTSEENRLNRRRHKSNKSGFKGVFLHKPGKWRAQIRVNNTRIHLGLFPTAEEAHAAYCEAAKLYHKEFASTQ